MKINKRNYSSDIKQSRIMNSSIESNSSLTNRSLGKKGSFSKIINSNMPSNIQVHIIMRPLIKLEILKDAAEALKVTSNKKITCGEDREYIFDQVYLDDFTKNEIFDNSIKNNLDRCMEGYNFTILAYGQTGTGKTYTMGTNFSKLDIDDDKGIIQLSLKYIFDKINASKNDSVYIVKASFLELYNEDIIDLLNLKTLSKNILIRESNSTVFLNGITETTICDSEDALNVLWTGSLNRKTAATISNEHSSRSHAIFSLIFEKIMSKHTIKFKLNFVDLAGSERIKKSGAVGERFKEAVSINSGLLALSKVITSLSNESNHIPFRESKLTRILKDSLGGNAITLMFACISPADICLDETINTLNYASFAKSVKIAPSINLINNNNLDFYENLKRENEELKKELEDIKNNSLYAENIKLKNLIKVLKKEKEISIDNILSNNLETDKDDEFEEILADNMGIDFSNRIKENMQLRNEIESLKKERDYYIDREKEMKQKLDCAADILNIGNEGEKVTDSNENKNIKINNIKSSSPYNSSRSSKNKVENNITIINDKIKKLKEFQNTLRHKMTENELSKLKVIKNKNEEVTFYKREMQEKSKQLKVLEMVNEKHSEILGYHEETISVLKNELRTKSQEIKNIKKITNSVPHSSRTEEKKNLKNIKIQPNNTQMVFFESLRQLLIKMEDNILNKHKYEKRLKIVEKEENDFNNMIKNNEEKIKNKINQLTKNKNNIENLLKAMEDNNKEKITFIQKLKATVGKINSLYIRLEKMISLKENTLIDIKKNKENINIKLAEINDNLIQTKQKITNGEFTKFNIDSDIEELYDSILDLENQLKEKNEKCVFLELDNINKENRIIELEKYLKEKINFYESRYTRLESELKTFKQTFNYKENIRENSLDRYMITVNREKKKNNLPPRRNNNTETNSVNLSGFDSSRENEKKEIRVSRKNKA